MRNEERTSQPAIREILLFGLVFLIFFQLLSDFIEAIYAFGLLGTSIPPEIAAVLLLFSPVLLIFLPRGISGRALIWLGELLLLCRVVEAGLDTHGRMLASGLGVGIFLIFFPTLLWRASQRKDSARSWTLGAGLALGVSLSILQRASCSGLDLSIQPGYPWIGWILAGTAAVLLPGAVRIETRRSRFEVQNAPEPKEGSRRVILPALGITSIFILLFFAFNAPNVIARWTGASYPLIVTVLGLALALFALLLALEPKLLSSLPPILLWAWNVVFVFCLVVTILAHQVRFPGDAGSYPLAEPPASPLALGSLAAMLALSPVLLWDFILLVRSLTSAPLSWRAVSGSFSLASLYLVLMIFAQVFTTVYDYIPVAGPFFRDKFWLAFLIPGVMVGAAVGPNLPSPPSRAIKDIAYGKGGDPGGSSKLPWSFPAVIGLAAVFSIVGVIISSARPAETPGGGQLRVLTYNIQQGYSADGQRSYTDVLELMRQVNADLIGLQESDTNRIAGGNADLVRYFADRLDLYSFYGPKTVTGTFGIALLSKYPLRNPRTFYLYSSGEQTAAIAAQVETPDRTFNIYVTHLGNGGPLIQQQQFLSDVDGKVNVIAMGDFNFEPDSDQYRLTRGLLADAWLAKWPAGMDDRGYDPADRIDHIFLSPELRVQDARHLTGPQSDHPAVWVEIGW